MKDDLDGFNIQANFTVPALKGRAKGERVGTSKLTKSNVDYIRYWWPIWEEQGRTWGKKSWLAEKFGVSPTTINSIIQHRTWYEERLEERKAKKPSLASTTTPEQEERSMWAQLEREAFK